MNNQKGNVLFLILIAVALFAALSYAVTSSTRTGGGDVSQEKAKTVAAALMQNLALIESTITRARVSNGCSETEISFNGFPNHTYDSRDECEIFNASAGGIPMLIIDPNILMPNTSGCANTLQVFNGNFDIDHTGNAEIIFQSNCVSDSVCTEFNKMIGITGIPVEANTGALPLYTYFKGSFNPSPPADSINDDTADLQNKDRFCRFQASTNMNQINYVVYRR